MLAICYFCGCLFVFICLSLWCWGLDVDLTVSVPSLFIYFAQVDLQIYCNFGELHNVKM